MAVLKFGHYSCTLDDEMSLPKWESCTVKAAAKRSGYSEEYIRRLIRSGKLKAEKIGTVYFVSVESLDEYIQDLPTDDDARFGPRRQR